MCKKDREKLPNIPPGSVGHPLCRFPESVEGSSVPLPNQMEPAASPCIRSVSFIEYIIIPMPFVDAL